MTQTITDWRSLRLKSLDIIICSGKSGISKNIEWLQRLRGFMPTAADLSHAAMVIKMPDIAADMLSVGISPTQTYVCETTTLNQWAGKKGLQINDFENWLDNYNGRVWIRQVSQISIPNNEIIKYIVTKLKDKDAQKYESGIPGFIELLLCEFGIKRAILQTATLHCTEFVAQTLFSFKVICQTYSPNRMPPVEWWPTVCKKNGECRPSLLDQQALSIISDPERIK